MKAWRQIGNESLGGTRKTSAGRSSNKRRSSSRRRSKSSGRGGAYGTEISHKRPRKLENDDVKDEIDLEGTT